MAVDQDVRPSFFQGQYLGPEDLTAAVDYERIQRARHNLGPHTWGLAIGLQLIEKPSPAGNNQVDVFLEPGFAWDGFGRTLLALAPYKLPASLFQSIAYDASIDDPTKSGQGAPGRPVKIWLRYSENAAQPPALGFEVCDSTGNNSRVQETFAIEIGEFVNVSDQRDPVSINGKTMDAQQALVTFDPTAPQIYDASIPHQALPEDDAQALWLVPVGYVRWLPAQNVNQTGSFQQRTSADLQRSEAARQYLGVVAEAVQAAGQIVRVKRRGNPPSSIASDDLLWVEGKMRVEGDAALLGGKLSFLNSAGQDAGVPLLIQRASSTDPGTLQTLTSLQIEIGKSNAGNNMLSVGPLDSGGKFVPVFNVMDSGKAGVGTTRPRNPLGVRAAGASEDLLSFEDPAGATRWHINQNPGGNNSGLNFAETNVADSRLFIQAGGRMGIGTQSPTGRLTLAGLTPPQGSLTLFSQNTDIEYDGGDDHLFVFTADGNASTAFLGGKIGINTTAPTTRLHVNDVVGIRQNRLYLSGDAGWSSVSYNACHDPTNTVWQFPDPTHSAVTIEMDDANGTPRFDVYTTTSGNTTGWQQRLHIDGNTGNIGINTPAPEGRMTLFSGAVQGKITFFSAASDMEYDGGNDNLFFFRALNNGRTAFLGSAFGVNNPNPTSALDVIGDVSITGDITANGNFYPSDERLKHAIAPLDGALQKLLALRGVHFEWNDPEKHGSRTGPQIGLIAQQVEQVFPQWVKQGADGYKTVGHPGLEALMIEAIRELNQKLDSIAGRGQVTRPTEIGENHE